MARAADECMFENDLCTRARRGYACDNTKDIRGLSFVDANNRLIKHVVDCIRQLQAKSGQTVKKFYIGKTYVNAEKGLDINPQDSTTYTKEGISRCWDECQQEDYGRDGMVVLTIVTSDAVPQDRRLHQEDYTLELNQALYDYFMAMPPYNRRIANRPPPSGEHILRASQAYALYMAYSLGGESVSEEEVVKDQTVEATWPIKIPQSSEKVGIVKDSTKEAKKIRQLTKEVVMAAGGESELEEWRAGPRARSSYACDYKPVNIEDLSFENAKKKLIEHVGNCYRELEAGSQTVTKFFIFKTYVDKEQDVPLNPQDSSTYTKDGINDLCRKYKQEDYGRDGMVVLTIVTKDAVPQARRPLDQEDYTRVQEDYTLELNQALYDHFSVTSPYKEKIANQDPTKGRRRDAPAYALCMTYSLEEKSSKGKAKKSVEDSKDQEVDQLTKKMSRLKPS